MADATRPPLDDVLLLAEALADRSRLLILQALLEGPRCVEDLAAALALASSTVSFHLKKLGRAGLVRGVRSQYYAVYEADRRALDRSLLELLAFENPAGAAQAQREERRRRKVLATFLRGGRLVRMPVQHRKRRVVLEEIARRFAPGERLPERAVDERLHAVDADHCTLRRLLVDEGLLARERGTYWATPPEGAAGSPAQAAAPPPRAGRAAPEKKMDRRKQLVRDYKDTPIPGGVYRIRHRESGRAWVASTPNLSGAFNSQRFQLELGSHRCRELQADWKAHGAGAFAFEVLEEVKPAEGSARVAAEDLKDVEKRWLAKLRPWGERGYNRRPD